jgi:hypothetical protein
MHSFKILPGLPASGELPVQFSETGMGTHREGFVVEFTPPSGLAWIGNFQGGVSGVSDVLEHPDGSSLIIIARGQAYIVSPENRTLLGTFGGTIESAIPVTAQGFIIFGNGLWFEAYGAAGCLWRSRRISWDGMRALSLKTDHLSGEAWSIEDVWLPFVLDIYNGECDGGANGL